MSYLRNDREMFVKFFSEKFFASVQQGDFDMCDCGVYGTCALCIWSVNVYIPMHVCSAETSFSSSSPRLPRLCAECAALEEIAILKEGLFFF